MNNLTVLSQFKVQSTLNNLLSVTFLSLEWLMEDGDKDGDEKLSKEELVEEFDLLTEDDDYWHEHRDEL